jgi:hypothetical protein
MPILLGGTLLIAILFDENKEEAFGRLGEIPRRVYEAERRGRHVGVPQSLGGVRGMAPTPLYF